MDFTKLGAAPATGVCDRGDLRSFEVGGVGAVFRLDEIILTGIGGHHEFVRRVAADGARVRLHRDVGQPASPEDRAVRVVHLPVSLVETAGALLGQVKRVGIFHQEFARPQHAALGPRLATEFRLNLIEV